MPLEREHLESREEIAVEDALDDCARDRVVLDDAARGERVREGVTRSGDKRLDAPVRSRVEAAKVEDMPRHQSLQRLEAAEDGVADRDEGKERAVEPTCEARTSSSQHGIRQAEARVDAP